MSLKEDIAAIQSNNKLKDEDGSVDLRCVACITKTAREIFEMLWHKEYKDYIMKTANVDEKFAEECLQALMGEYDYDDDPTVSANEEMSCWSD